VIAFIPMWLQCMPATIMSLGGIAIAIGATVDAEIVMVEAAHKKLEHAPKRHLEEERSKLLARRARGDARDLLLAADHRRVVPAGLRPHGQAGQALRPLAFMKTFVMLSAALLSITVAPALRDFLLRGKIYSEAQAHPSRA
jgi:Cu(I)/Ag(I) efflux system membrane protein CusA/SilA